jgi:hypothetical protein
MDCDCDCGMLPRLTIEAGGIVTRACPRCGSGAAAVQGVIGVWDREELRATAAEPRALSLASLDPTWPREHRDARCGSCSGRVVVILRLPVPDPACPTIYAEVCHSCHAVWRPRA